MADNPYGGYILIRSICTAMPRSESRRSAASTMVRHPITPVLVSAHIKEGDDVVHVGAGYYTAIMAHLIGSSGKVTAIDYDPKLAARARDNPASLGNATVIKGDGAAVDFELADVTYVNAGRRIRDPWLDG